MIEIVNLKNTLNPITAAERVKINENWDEIRRAFSQIQLQVNFLAGGQEVESIIERIDNAITLAEQGAQNAINQVADALQQLNQVINNSEAATQQTNVARDEAIAATNSALNAINEIMLFMDEFRSLGPYSSTTEYKRNNMASLNGNTYIAISDNVGVPTTNTNVWALFARRGFDGERGPQGEAGASLNVKGSLPNESALPSTGVAGDAYTINGNLFVWSVETSGWVNVGQIKGEKGDKGDAGESGFYQLANFQYVINATSNGQTTLQIPLESFDENNHSLLLFRNSTAQANDKYSVSGRTITLNEPVTNYTETSFYLFITQGVLIQPQETINASFIQNGTITEAKLANSVVTKLNEPGFSGNYNDLTNKPTIPAPYTLPIASTSVTGGIKVDGTTITVNPSTGVASASGSNTKAGEFIFFAKGSVQSIPTNATTQVLFTGSSSGYTTSDWATKNSSNRIYISEPGVYRATASLNFDGSANSSIMVTVDVANSGFTTTYTTDFRIPSTNTFRITEPTVLSLTVRHSSSSSLNLVWANSGCLIERLM